MIDLNRIERELMIQEQLLVALHISKGYYPVDITSLQVLYLSVLALLVSRCEKFLHILSC